MTNGILDTVVPTFLNGRIKVGKLKHLIGLLPDKVLYPIVKNFSLGGLVFHFLNQFWRANLVIGVRYVGHQRAKHHSQDPQHSSY